MARIIVIGAGMGGLAAAARLAAQRHTVTVVEQAATHGGKLGVYSRDGFTFDTGPSLLTLPAVYRDLFLKTGPALEECVDLVAVDPVCRYRFADGTWVDIPNASRSRISQAFDEAFGEPAGEEWNRFVDRAGDIWEVTRRPFLETPLAGMGDLVRQAGRVRDLRTVAPWRSLRGLGRRYLSDPRLRTYLDRYATYAGSDPRKTPAALAVVPYVEQTFGAWYVRGGLHRLSDALHQRCLDLGVKFRFGTMVTAVTTDGGKADGVRLADGQRMTADIVVSDADARHLYTDLIHEPTTLARLNRTVPSSSAFVLLLALRGRTPQVAHHTVLFPEDYDAEFDALFSARRARPVEDPAVYICAPDDAALRPDDEHEAWFVLVNAPRHNRSGTPGTVDWTAAGLRESYADRVLDVMAGRGIDVRGRVLWREIRTPADLENSTRCPGGAIYGTSCNGARAAFLRPANRSPHPGLFLVGGSAHPGGGLPLVGMSAAIVAELIGKA